MKSINHKIELLAPAGSFQGFIGAINGGADAVYLAGDRFGARAYANNFNREEMLEVLFLAKLHNVKVYLTVNTLLKNMEINELYDYIEPFYKMGLDGVIIQDFGVFSYLQNHFPGLELHASTQMTVTSLEGAKYLTECGANRVVLSRELTMQEIKNIIDAGIETECFIHGSMCYCYSGQCLFSSLIGGRSGNRGRCAQPCRLPYKVQENKKEEYCLSLKDMCTLEHLPELIESGITSFKIEGRMKNPAYAAWVTRIYRKYIDLYLANPQKPFKVDKKDLEQLKTLYIRTALQDGYYHKYRGKSMITVDSPAYSKTDETFVERITEEMIHNKPKKGISMKADFIVGKPCTLKASVVVGETKINVDVVGAEVQAAQKAPLQEDSIKERLLKTGDSPFCVEYIDVNVSGEVFLPVKAINELRRDVLDKLQEAIKVYIMTARSNEVLQKSNHSYNLIKKETTGSEKTEYIAFVETFEQYEAVLNASFISRIVLPYGWLLKEKHVVKNMKQSCDAMKKQVYWALPAVCRNESWNRIAQAVNVVKDFSFGEGFYANQVDSMAFLLKKCPDKSCIGDINLYATNNVSIEWLSERIAGFTLSVELNKDELRHLASENGELILYGRMPLMQTANCIFLTENACSKRMGQDVVKENKTGVLNDRTKAKFPYRTHCDEEVCYNTIYNSVATSLHKQKSAVDRILCRKYQLRFTVETGQETEEILHLYEAFSKNELAEDVSFAYTNGHFMRGIQ